MSDPNRPFSDNLNAFSAAGATVLANREPFGATPLTTLGCTLASGTTYYVPFAAQHAPTPSETPYLELALRWDAAAILTVTIESTVYSPFSVGTTVNGPVLLSDFHDSSTAPGFWVPETATSLPAAQYLGSGTGGATFTAPSLAVAGGTAGGGIFRLFNYGSRRGRLKVVVGGTGGVVRFGAWGKLAS